MTLIGHYNWMLWNRIEKDERKAFICIKNLQRWIKLMEHKMLDTFTGVKNNGCREFISYQKFTEMD